MNRHDDHAIIAALEPGGLVPDLLSGPLPWRNDGKSFIELPIPAQNQVLGRYLETILGEVRALRAEVNRLGGEAA